MLCQFAHAFPDFLANFLQTGEQLDRRFREETATDLLMAGLLALAPLGIEVQTPPEGTTGADMEWVFVAPNVGPRGRHLRLLIQAKRASLRRTQGASVWCYAHLDHLKGGQAQTLVSAALIGPKSPAVPLYVFYHPRSALMADASGLPDVEGVNFVFAHEVLPVVAQGGCRMRDKLVSRWRPHFMPLAEFLCFPSPMRRGTLGGVQALSFLDGTLVWKGDGVFDPDEIAQRLQKRTELTGAGPAETLITASDGIPEDIWSDVDSGIRAEVAVQPNGRRVIFHCTRQAGERSRVDEDGSAD